MGERDDKKGADGRALYTCYWHKMCGSWTGAPINSFPGVHAGNYPFQFSSDHEGGCFVCFADGAVRFLSENIDQTTLTALGTRAVNELVDDEDY